MKLKSHPDDFFVEERTDVVPSTGRFAFYRLDKRNLTTLDAVSTIKKRWHLRGNQVSFGGLKDRHAETRQFLTIFRGPPRNLSDRGLELSFRGHVGKHYTAADIRGNFFRVVVRNLPKSQATQAANVAAEIGQSGFPNYFDDQRFGSFADGEFVARLMVLGQYEDALRLALTAAYEFDSAATKREKQLLTKLWGQWEDVWPRLSSKAMREVVSHLRREPADFRGAVARLWPESQGLYLAAYQSHIWNRMLSELIWQRFGENRSVTLALKTEPVLAPKRISREESVQLSELQLPLPSARLRFDPDAVWAPLVSAALTNEGFSLQEMKLPGLRKPFFSKGDRAAWVVPREIAAKIDSDDKHAEKAKLTLSFELPRGSYATILIKRVTQSS